MTGLSIPIDHLPGKAAHFININSFFLKNGGSLAGFLDLYQNLFDIGRNGIVIACRNRFAGDKLTPDSQRGGTGLDPSKDILFFNRYTTGGQELHPSHGCAQRADESRATIQRPANKALVPVSKPEMNPSILCGPSGSAPLGMYW